jgi:hypothetical protein
MTRDEANEIARTAAKRRLEDGRPADQPFRAQDWVLDAIIAATPTDRRPRVRGARCGAEGEERMTNLREQIVGAVARGWCAPANSAKEMDSDLAFAIERVERSERGGRLAAVPDHRFRGADAADRAGPVRGEGRGRGSVVAAPTASGQRAKGGMMC